MTHISELQIKPDYFFYSVLVPVNLRGRKWRTKKKGISLILQTNIPLLGTTANLFLE